MEFIGVFSALISFTSVVIWYNFEFILSDFLLDFLVFAMFSVLVSFWVLL